MNIPELRQKAESGSVVDQAVLGLCYLYGREVEINYVEAFRLLSIAKDKGASRAVVNLAHMYAEGLGVAQDITRSIRFYEAVAKVEPRARLELGRIYSCGIGVPVNPELALQHYSVIARRDDTIEGQTTAAFIGALTATEIQEAQNYLRNAV